MEEFNSKQMGVILSNQYPDKIVSIQWQQLADINEAQPSPYFYYFHSIDDVVTNLIKRYHGEDIHFSLLDYTFMNSIEKIYIKASSKN